MRNATALIKPNTIYKQKRVNTFDEESQYSQYSSQAMRMVCKDLQSELNVPKGGLQKSARRNMRTVIFFDEDQVSSPEVELAKDSGHSTETAQTETARGIMSECSQLQYKANSKQGVSITLQEQSNNISKTITRAREVEKQSMLLQETVLKKMNFQGQISKQLLLRPLASPFTFLLRRDKKNRNGKLQFNLYEEQDLGHLLTIRKEYSGLFICLRKRAEKMRYEYEEVAEIKSSLLGSKFTLLDNDTKASLVTICHQREFLGLWGARQMDVYFPKDIIMESCLKECYESEKYLGKIEKYSCEFALQPLANSRQKQDRQKSKKNFKLLMPNSPSEWLLQFFKQGTDVFQLTAKAPFSLIQSVAICLTMFQVDSSFVN